VKLLNSQAIIKANRYKWIAIAVVLIALMALPLCIENNYIKHLLIMACIGTILGMTFSMLYSSGLITLGAAAFYAVGAYTSTVLVMNAGLSFWAAIPLTLIIAAVLALGFGAVFVRNAGVAFVIITLIFVQVVVLAAAQADFLGGWGGIIGIPRPNPLGNVSFATKTEFYYLVLAMLLLTVLVFNALYSSRIGRAWRAIKLSPNLAGTLGINPYRYRLLAFVIGSTAAALAGCFYAHYSQSITPGAFGGWLSIYVQLYAVLGGLEFYILGPAIGALVMTFVPEYLRVVKEWEPIITGVLLLVVILFFPGGILGTIKGPRALNMNNLQSLLKRLKARLPQNKSG
jgi:branched-chain amino acid transport system permease protein